MNFELKKITLLIFTDIDGTLINAKNYSIGNISSFLSKVNKTFFLILNSSKTYAEVASFAKRHNITHPFITENGSVIYVPRNYFDFSFENYELSGA